MRYELVVNAYDVMDLVQFTVRLRAGTGTSDDPFEWQTLTSSTVQGVGEADQREWARDVLVAVLERL